MVSVREDTNRGKSINLLNCKHRIGFCTSVAGQTNFSYLQIQAVVRAGNNFKL